LVNCLISFSKGRTWVEADYINFARSREYRPVPGLLNSDKKIG
jgi:hypothetical protein